ncbi:MAG: nuclear transport factor 2 family protein [Acidimicrobiales bacterium]
MSEQSESLKEIARQLRSALESADLSAFSGLLDPKVRWGPPGDQSPPCQSREQVLAWYERAKDRGVSAKVSESTVVGDRIIVGLVVAGSDAAQQRGGEALRWQVFTMRNGRVVEIVGFDLRSEAVEWAGAHAG